MDPDSEITDEELDRNMEDHGVTRVALDIALPGVAEVCIMGSTSVQMGICK